MSRALARLKIQQQVGHALAFHPVLHGGKRSLGQRRCSAFTSEWSIGLMCRGHRLRAGLLGS